VARDALKLSTGLAAGMPIGADVAASEPAVVGAIRIGTEVSLGVDSAPASSGEGNQGRGRARRRGAFVGSLLTGLAERFVEESAEGFGLFGAFTPALVGFKGRLRRTGWVVGQPDMDEEEINTRATSRHW
jgi:hypothetical protein